jgi:4-aminobutyrate aminotransferase-like enzyme
LGGTYGGNPLSIAAGHAVLDVIEAEGLCARAARIGAQMRNDLEKLAKEVPAIGEVRGLGAMLAFEMVKDPKTREPDAAVTAAILANAERSGLILLSCGTAANVVRLLTPLTIPEPVLTEGLGILSAAVREATGAAKGTAAAGGAAPSSARAVA